MKALSLTQPWATLTLLEMIGVLERIAKEKESAPGDQSRGAFRVPSRF
jgi:hypothetical protein